MLVKRGEEAEAGAKKETGYRDGRREAEVEKGKEVAARREEETGAKNASSEDGLQKTVKVKCMIYFPTFVHNILFLSLE